MARIPGTATHIDRVEGMLPSGQWAGQFFFMSLWTGDISQGYKSNYEKVPASWIELFIDAGPHKIFQYTGRNLGAAEVQITDMMNALTEVRGV